MCSPTAAQSQAFPGRAAPLLSALFVNPSHRRRGVAGELMRAAEEQAIGWGHEELVLNVQRSNTAAQGLYAKLGYVPDVEPEAALQRRWWADGGMSRGTCC